MAVDFSKAFDTVDHMALLSCLLDTSLDSNSIRWIFVPILPGFSPGPTC